MLRIENLPTKLKLRTLNVTVPPSQRAYTQHFSALNTGVDHSGNLWDKSYDIFGNLKSLGHEFFTWLTLCRLLIRQAVRKLGNYQTHIQFGRRPRRWLWKFFKNEWLRFHIVSYLWLTLPSLSVLRGNNSFVFVYYNQWTLVRQNEPKRVKQRKFTRKTRFFSL